MRNFLKFIKTAMTLKYFMVIVVFFCTIFNGQSQQITPLRKLVDSIYSSENEHTVKIASFQKILAGLDTTKSIKDLDHLYNRLSLTYNRVGKYKKAIEHTKKAIHLRNVLDTTTSYALSNYWFNLTYYYGSLQNLDKREEILTEIVSVNAPNKFTYKSHIELGLTLADKGDYFKALSHFKKASNSFPIHKDSITILKAHQGFIFTYGSMDETLRNMKNIEFHKSKIDHFAKNGWGVHPSVYNNLAVIYEDIDQIDNAINQYQKTLDIYLNWDDQESIATIYNNLGRMHARKGEYKKATGYFQKALEISKDQEVIAMTYDNQGYYLQTSRSIDKVPYYLKAIHTLLQNTDIKKLPSFEQIKASEYKLDILNYLIDTAEALVMAYHEEKQENYLTSAEETLFLIDKLVSLIRFDSSVDQSKLFWIRKSVNTYMLGVKVSYLLNNVENAFYFMEKNKALVLLENLNGAVQQPTILSLEESIQKHVDANTNLIEYILNDKEGYAIFCTEGEKKFFKIQDAQAVSKLVLEYQQLVSKPIVKKETVMAYNKTTSTLFGQLFSFENAFEQLKGKNVLIIPDYVLQNIPFEALKATPESDYLIKDVTISYLQSASVFNALDRNDKTASKRILSVAPIDFQDQNLISLSGTKDDIAQISDLFSGDELVQRKASKERFIDRLAKYRLIHLNTHAGFDTIQKTPWIAFNDQKLHLDEIYALNNNADLIVLDACKSADGSLEIGEGVMSLARGFFYNGTKSVIAAQWNSNEKSNNEILIDFYKALQKGSNKAAALRTAKLTYLDSHQLSEKSPYYWASLTLTGDIDTIDLTIPFYMRLELWGAALILFFILFSMRRRKNQL